MWPNVERTVGNYLASVIEGRVVAVLPARLEESLPVTRLTVASGDDDGITDSVLLDVETFGSSRFFMWELAEETRQAMLGLSGRAVDGELVDTVRTAVRPYPLDYGNPKVHRAVASYRLALRQTSAA
jgi:hypothetical protein